jgi:hypothetical protein
VDDLVSVTWVGNEHEAAMVQALLKEHGIPSLQRQMGLDGGVLGEGFLPGGGSRQVLVHRHRAEEARALVEAVQAETEQEVPDPVNARYLEEGEGRRGPRNYGLIGGFARIYLASFVAIALIFGVWLLLRALGLT